MKRFLALLNILLLCCSLSLHSYASASGLPEDDTSEETTSEETTLADHYAGLIEDGRRTYTEDNRPSKPVLNSLADSSVMGDERQFIVVTEIDPDSDPIYFDWPDAQTYQKYEEMTPVNLYPDGLYRVIIYYHNDGVATSKNSNVNVNNAHIKVDFPSTITAEDTDAVILATITSDNASPSSISSLVRISAQYEAKLRLVNNSIMIHSGGQSNSATLSTDIFTDGVKIGYNYLNGIIPDNNFGYISFEFKVVPTDPDALSDDMYVRTEDISTSVPATSASELRVFMGLTVKDVTIISIVILVLVFAGCVGRSIWNHLHPESDDDDE